jgi:hypothetical protein
LLLAQSCKAGAAIRRSGAKHTLAENLATGTGTWRAEPSTKGGRPRDTQILNAKAVKNAVENAFAVAGERNGRLIDKPTLKSAMKYWSNQAARLGLSGKYSPHSLRYAWAQDAVDHYLAQGFSEQEALAQTAMDLGHGDGRWVGRSICKGMKYIDSFNLSI